MKKIIALYRSSNKGKTATLNLVIDLLQALTTGCPMPAPQLPHVDRKQTFNYNGQIVSICTAGDNKSELLKNEVYFNAHRCDVAITASRTTGQTVTAIQNMSAKYSINPIWRRKLVGNNHYPLNMSDAWYIISLI